SLVFDNNANVGSTGYCPLINANTNSTGLDLGTANYATQSDTLSCVSFVKNAPNYTVSSAFDLVVNKANTSSANYRVQVSMSSAAPANVTWSLNNLALTTSAQTLQAANAYG